MRDDIHIQAGWRPGLLGDIVGLHGRHYALHWNFGPFFEAKVAGELAEFVRRRHQSPSELWCAADGNDRFAGSVVIDGGKGLEHPAHLRWFIVDSSCQGLGIGARLLDAAVDFCRGRGFGGVELWTFAGLHPARHLYQSRGFALTDERSGQTWGSPVTEQRFELSL